MNLDICVSEAEVARLCYCAVGAMVMLDFVKVKKE
jgi:hypothetical protein